MTARIVASDVESALEPARAFVVHAGDDRYPLSESVEAIGVPASASWPASCGAARDVFPRGRGLAACAV